MTDSLNNRGKLIDGTRKLLACVAPWMAEVSVLNWDGSKGFLPVIRRSILRRQFEFLEVIKQLVEACNGYAAVPLLRPACEELLWLKYLNSLAESDAQLLVDCLIDFGLLRDLEAQSREVGESVMNSIGLTQHLASFQSKEPSLQDNLRILGRKLGWPGKTLKNGDPPSAWFLAKATASESLYRFLYHATSRYVHFSAVELARRGWGRPGHLELSSHTYEPVWAQFALAWGTRLFDWTLQASLDSLKAEGVFEPDHKGLLVAFNIIKSVSLIPLVTPGELIWNPASGET